MTFLKSIFPKWSLDCVAASLQVPAHTAHYKDHCALQPPVGLILGTSLSWHGAALGPCSPEPPSSAVRPEPGMFQFHGASHQCHPGPGGYLSPWELYATVCLSGFPFTLLACGRLPLLTLPFSPLGPGVRFWPASGGRLPPDSEVSLQGPLGGDYAVLGKEWVGMTPDHQSELLHAHSLLGAAVSRLANRGRILPKSLPSWLSRIQLPASIICSWLLHRLLASGFTSPRLSATLSLRR